MLCQQRFQLRLLVLLFLGVLDRAALRNKFGVSSDENHPFATMYIPGPFHSLNGAGSRSGPTEGCVVFETEVVDHAADFSRKFEEGKWLLDIVLFAIAVFFAIALLLLLFSRSFLGQFGLLFAELC